MWFEASSTQTRVGGSMYRGEDFRSSISRSASHVCDSFASKGSARDGHHVIVGSHNFADDFSLHSRDAGESPHRSRFPNKASFAVSSKTGSRQKRANWLLGPKECDRMTHGKLLKRNGG